jgi:hypothetical protein
VADLVVEHASIAIAIRAESVAAKSAYAIHRAKLESGGWRLY